MISRQAYVLLATFERSMTIKDAQSLIDYIDDHPMQRVGATRNETALIDLARMKVNNAQQ